MPDREQRRVAAEREHDRAADRGGERLRQGGGDVDDAEVLRVRVLRRQHLAHERLVDRLEHAEAEAGDEGHRSASP